MPTCQRVRDANFAVGPQEIIVVDTESDSVCCITNRGVLPCRLERCCASRANLICRRRVRQLAPAGRVRGPAAGHLQCARPPSRPVLGATAGARQGARAALGRARRRPSAGLDGAGRRRALGDSAPRPARAARRALPLL